MVLRLSVDQLLDKMSFIRGLHPSDSIQILLMVGLFVLILFTFCSHEINERMVIIISSIINHFEFLSQLRIFLFLAVFYFLQLSLHVHLALRLFLIVEYFTLGFFSRLLSYCFVFLNMLQNDRGENVVFLLLCELSFVDMYISSSVLVKRQSLVFVVKYAVSKIVSSL